MTHPPTPEPWIADGIEYGAPGQRRAIIRCDGLRPYTIALVCCDEDDEEQARNVRVIQQAPAMLRLLRQIADNETDGTVRLELRILFAMIDGPLCKATE